jgi:hypothetical protein
MKHNAKLLVATIAISLVLQASPVAAEPESLKSLSAQWWQWALSIPTAQNPLLDTTGANCMVGQRGSTWFLAGLFGGGAPIIRNCTVPDNVELFLPVVNSVNLNAPNVCGQGPANISVAELRAGAAPFIDGSLNLLVELDGKPIRSRRAQSRVFAAALPEDNIFDAPCESAGGVPAGIFSPAIDDGFYVQLDSLKAGQHMLHIHAENPSAGFVMDVTYNLSVKRVLTK